MTICSQCHYRYYNDDLRLDCCRAGQAPISNPVTGERYCETINKDGNCEFFRPDKRFLKYGMMFAGVLFICTILAWPLWSWTQDGREKRAYQRQVKITEKAQLGEIEAKLPVKIYKGIYDGREFIIKEYKPYRE